MAKNEKILTLDNQIQAKLLEEILTEKGIPSIMRSYHDSAYDGLWQVQSGWGHVEAPAVYRDEILTIYNKIKGNDPS